MTHRTSIEESIARIEKWQNALGGVVKLRK